MIDIQESALCSFKKEVLSLSHGGVNQWERVHHKRLETLTCCKTRIERFLERNGLHPMGLEQRIVCPNTFFEQSGEAFGMHEIPETDPLTGCLVHVSRPNPPLGRTDFLFASRLFPQRIEFTVIGHHQMGVLADEQTSPHTNLELE